MRTLLNFTLITLIALSCGGIQNAVSAQNESEKASPKPGETSSKEEVPREYQGFAEVAEFHGVIDDPDGYVNLRNAPRTDAPVITKVTSGEPFSFQRKENEPWCKVKLRSGVTGWMHYSRIKLFFTKADLPGKPEKGDEIDEQAHKQGVNYYETTQAAARGDNQALKTFFSLDADGAAAEEHVGVTSVVIHLIGDDAFARLLRNQSRDFRESMRFAWDLGLFFPFDTKEYFRQHFPKSAKLLFASE
jgi:uncharacterized protein YgiM (DUF1202 family)